VQSATVLVVDDDPLVRELMTRYLARDGFQVITAASAAEALRVARSEHPSAITLDVNMPEMDGWNALAAFKADPHLATIPVVMVTIDDDRKKAQAMGVAGYLLKPIDAARLIATLRKLSTAPPPDRPILVIEDDAANREVLGRFLRRSGYSVIEAANGRAALERLAEGLPRLILLDLMMPVMDGFRFVQELQHLALQSLPIVVITARDLSNEERQQLGHAVSKVFVKGTYNSEQLSRKIHDLLGTTK
jgi:CheY-like chemotaxis protein